MKKIKLNLLFLAASVLILVATPALALARESESPSPNYTTSSGEGSSSSTSEIRDKIKLEVQRKKADNELKAKDQVEQLRKTKERHTAKERTKNCEAAKAGLTKRLTNLQKNAAKYEARIDSAYEKALTFQASHNLNPDGISDLEVKVGTAKIAAQSSVDALSNLSVNLDCNSETVATNVQAFKAASDQAKTDLKAYKEAVKAVLVALKEANKE